MFTTTHPLITHSLTAKKGLTRTSSFYLVLILVQGYCKCIIVLKDDKGQQKGNALWPFAMSYTILQYSTVLPFTFATFLDFALFNTPPNCIAFSGTFHQTLFTWLVHHSSGFSGIILLQSALHFTDILRFILLLQLYLWFLLPPLPNRTDSSPLTVVRW